MSPLAIIVELVELTLDAVCKAREAHDFGDVEELCVLLGAAERNLGELRQIIGRAASEEAS